MGNNIGLIFINGAGLNRSIWNDIKEYIPNPILTIDYPNRGSDSHLNANLAFDDYVRKAANEVKNWKNDNFIIVAHSIGACVGLKIAQQFKNELQGFVAISSVIPISGQSFATSLPFPQKVLLPILLTLFGTKPPKKSIEAELCNDLTPETTLKIVNDFTPESKQLYTTKFSFDLPDTKRLYIKLTNDKSMPIDLQDKMARNLNATNVETIDSGHLPMLSKPKDLAKILTGFATELMQEKNATTR